MKGTPHRRDAARKRIDKLREILREGFHADADPVPFKEGVGFEVAFKLESGPALD